MNLLGIEVDIVVGTDPLEVEPGRVFIQNITYISSASQDGKDRCQIGLVGGDGVIVNHPCDDVWDAIRVVIANSPDRYIFRPTE